MIGAGHEATNLERHESPQIPRLARVSASFKTSGA
jgi:hypothetical protein